MYDVSSHTTAPSMYFLHLTNSDNAPPHRTSSRDSPSGNLSESQQPAITCHLPPSGVTPWPSCQSQASKMWKWEGIWQTHTLTVDLSDPAGLYSGSTDTHLLYTVLSCTYEFLVLLWRSQQVTNEAVLLCLPLFFPSWSASDRKTTMNHWLTQLGTKDPLWICMNTSLLEKNMHGIHGINNAAVKNHMCISNTSVEMKRTEKEWSLFKHHIIQDNSTEVIIAEMCCSEDQHQIHSKYIYKIQ